MSLLGTALTCALFGTSTTLPQAFAVRLMQGVFAGAIGVARGCVSQITDSSNEGRAYSIIGCAALLCVVKGLADTAADSAGASEVSWAP